MLNKELKCELCGYTYLKDDLVNTDKYNGICQDCYDEHYTTCYSCDIKLLKEDAIASEFNDKFYCDNCYIAKYAKIIAQELSGGKE